jgi:hypothetical protein
MQRLKAALRGVRGGPARPALKRQLPPLLTRGQPTDRSLRHSSIELLEKAALRKNLTNTPV